LQPTADDRVTIPNFNLYCRFIDYCRGQLGRPSGVPRNQHARFFFGKGKLAISFARATEDTPAKEEIEEVPEVPATTVLGIATEEDIPRRFAELFHLLEPDEDKED
jgi:hypothetical protein